MDTGNSSQVLTFSISFNWYLTSLNADEPKFPPATLPQQPAKQVAKLREAGARVVIDLALNTASGGDADGDSLISIQGLIGSALNDFLAGGTGADHITGGASGDNINGRAGDDWLIGGPGADLMLARLAAFATCDQVGHYRIGRNRSTGQLKPIKHSRMVSPSWKPMK